MEITVTPAQMKQLETEFMRSEEIPAALLMEHAAQGVAQAMRGIAPEGHALFLCGPGNNGGDGYAAARLWHDAGNQAVIWELTADARGDAAMNRRLAIRRGIPVLSGGALPVLSGFDLLCDALFGTGLNRAPEGEAAAVIEAVNASGLPVVAVDIPSGLDGTTGRVPGCAIHATVTVTFARVKQGLVIGGSADYVGRLICHPILIPADFGPRDGLRCLTPEDLPGLIPPRCPSSHKGTYGRTVIFAGSFGMAGAAAMCAEAAMRAGSGLTVILARASIVPVLQTLVPGATCTVLPEENGRLTAESAGIAARALEGASAAAAGCGLSRDESALPVLRVFREAGCPVVWDADALNLLAEHGELLPLPAKDFITPHPGEAARLLSCSVREITDDPLQAAGRLHGLAGCSVLLKGARTVMTDGTALAVNRFGSPVMARGGSGDILTGILAGLTAQRLTPDPLTALQCAALLHGMAGIRADEKYGAYSVLPRQLLEEIRVR